MWTALGALLLALTPASAARQLGQMSVHDAQNRTVCPFKVVTDVDHNRVPARIRTTQCADEPLALCRAGTLPPEDCCDHYHDGYYFECAELRETVVVWYKDRPRDEPSTYDVAVGCTCRIGVVHDAAELPSGPSRRLALGVVQN